MRIWSGS